MQPFFSRSKMNKWNKRKMEATIVCAAEDIQWLNSFDLQKGKLRQFSLQNGRKIEYVPLIDYM